MAEHLKCGTCIMWFKDLAPADIKAAFAGDDTLSVDIQAAT